MGSRERKSWLPTGDRGSVLENFRVFLENKSETPVYSEGKLLKRFMKWEIPESEVKLLSNTLMEKTKEWKNARARVPQSVPDWEAPQSVQDLKSEVRRLNKALLKGTLFKNLMEVEAWENDADELMDEFVKKKLETEIEDLKGGLRGKFQEIEAMQIRKAELQSTLMEKNREMVHKLKERSREMVHKLKERNRETVHKLEKQNWLKTSEMAGEVAEKNSELAFKRKEAEAQRLRLKEECDALRSRAKQTEDTSESIRKKLWEEESKCGELQKELLEIRMKSDRHAINMTNELEDLKRGSRREKETLMLKYQEASILLAERVPGLNMNLQQMERKRNTEADEGEDFQQTEKDGETEQVARKRSKK